MAARQEPASPEARHPDALRALGLAAFRQGRLEEALASFDRALALRPGSPDGLCMRAGILLALQRPAEALADLDRALALRPDFVEALNERGNALRELRRPAEALASYDRALALRPDLVAVRCNRGSALLDLGRAGDAAAEFTAAIAQSPGLAEAHNNLATALTALGRVEAALAHYDRAIALKPEYADALANKGYSLLLLGRLREGWDLLESRWRTPRFRPFLRREDKPRWHGEALAGRTVLLHAEQGLGDTIQFCRYAPLLAERAAREGGQVVLEVQPALAPLLRGQFAGVHVVAAGAPPPHDLHCPLLSLPGAFGTDLATIPAPPAYLRAAPARLDHWRQRLGAHAGPLLGLAWSGDPKHRRDRSRSLPLARLRPLLDAGASLFALQPEVRPDDRATLAATPGIVDLGPSLTGFVETAAAIAALDLVIAVDTSVAHLAAALGKPTWLLVAFAPDWRWLREREDTPWYPSMRLFRQTAPDDWDGVIARVRAALAERGSAVQDGDAEAHLRRGNALIGQQRFEDALACYERAIALQPELAEAHCNRGNALRELRRPAEALACYDRALILQPGFVAARSNRGNALVDLGRPDEAIAEYARVIAARPGLPEPHCNMAYALTALGRPQEGLAIYDRAIALQPDYADAHVGRGSNLLLLGRFGEGWAEQEWRWRQPRFLAMARGLAGCRWEGEDLAGRTLLVIAEQGLGDTIQFCRYLPSLAERAAREGGRVRLEVQAPLLALLRDQFPGVPVHAMGEARPPFDLACPMLSLPRLFGTELATIPAPRGYLRADPLRVARWRERLRPYAAPRIGLAWSGNLRQLEDARRSVPLAKLLPLLGAGGTLFGLPPEVRDADRATLAANPAIVDLGPSFPDFAETAAAIAALDVVVAVDTSVSHVAAALGKPTWVLLSFAPDWRWLRGREDSPWYPSARLFRQPARGDWDRVVARVGAGLAGWTP